MITENDSEYERFRNKTDAHLLQFNIDVDTLSLDKIHALYYDLRERHQKLEIQYTELRRSQKYFENTCYDYFELYNLAPVGYLLLNCNGLILQANQKFAEFIALDLSKIINQPFNQFIACTDRTAFAAFFQAFFDESENNHHYLRLFPATGSEFFVQLQGRTIIEANANHSKLMLAISDIENLKQSENELKNAHLAARQENLAKSDLLAHISHEIRTPMNAILGFLDIAKDSKNLENINEYLDLSQKSAEHLLNLINDVLDLSRLNAGKIDLIPRTFHLSAMLQLCLRVFQDMVKNKHLELHLNLAENLPHHIYSDENRLKQILLNLLSNAIKFTDNGVIILKAEVEYQSNKKHGYLKLSVQDTGKGIPDNFLSKIFNKYEQIENTPNDITTGSGLGLNICQILVNEFGGKLQVESVPDKGSTFYFTIPIKIESPPPAHSSNFDSLKKTPNAKKILIAEDNSVNMRLILAIMECLEHKVISVHNGQQVLEVLQTFDDIDLILMDIEMPLMDGLETTQSIRIGNAGEKYRHLPILAMTAHALSEVEEKCLAIGMNGFIRKPIQIHTLDTIIQTHAL